MQNICSKAEIYSLIYWVRSTWYFKALSLDTEHLDLFQMGRLRVTSPNAGGETVVHTDKEKNREPDMYTASCLSNEIQ